MLEIHHHNCLYDCEDVSLHLILTSTSNNLHCQFALLIWLTAAASTMINPAAMSILTHWKPRTDRDSACQSSETLIYTVCSYLLWDHSGNKPASHDELCCTENHGSHFYSSYLPAEMWLQLQSVGLMLKPTKLGVFAEWLFSVCCSHNKFNILSLFAK